MGTRAFVRWGVVGVLALGGALLGPPPASATNMWWQQAILLIHVPIGGGQFFTTNQVFTASQGGNTTVNVKCFNDSFQRVGPAAGVNVELSATGQLAQQTPITLAVVGDPLFAGIGWCWARNISSVQDFNVQTTIGATPDLSPGGILNAGASTLVGANTGLAETSSNLGGIPFFTTSGGVANFALFVNPLPTARTVTLQLFDANGVPQGGSLVRNLSGRDMDILSIPGAFGLPTPPTTGSVRITANGNGYLGWIVQLYPGNRLIFVAIGLDGDDRFFLAPGDAP
jgi:hypothetical protein